MPWLPAAAAIAGLATSAATAIGTAANGGGGKSAPAWNAQKGAGYSPEAWNYRGGGGMGAGQRADWYDQQAADAQKRQAAQANYDQARAMLTRGHGNENEALGMLRDAALGGAPSLAERQLNVGLDAAMRSQESMRASARGAAGVAMADYGAAANIAMAQQQVNQQAGLLRAQEMQQARDAYAQMAGAARGRDISAAGLEGGWSQFNTEQQMRQKELNDRMQMGMLGLGEGVSSQQLNANMAQQNALQRAYEASVGAQERADAAQRDATNRAIGTGLSGASGAFNAVASAYGPKATKKTVTKKMPDGSTVTTEEG